MPASVKSENSINAAPGTKSFLLSKIHFRIAPSFAIRARNVGRVPLRKRFGELWIGEGEGDEEGEREGEREREGGFGDTQRGDIGSEKAGSNTEQTAIARPFSRPLSEAVIELRLYQAWYKGLCF